MIFWYITLDYGLIHKQIRYLAEEIQKNLYQKPREKENIQLKKRMKAEFQEKFCKKGINLLHSTAYKAIDFYKFIANTHKREEYAHNFTQVI